MKSSKNEWIEGFWFGWSAALAGGVIAIIIILILRDIGGMTLKNVFDQDYFAIEGNRYTDEEMRAMPLDDLETLKILIKKKVSGLSAAITEKKMDFANGGPGASKEWMKIHKNGLSINQRVLEYVIYLIKKRRRIERKIGDCFMAAAMDILPRGDYERILTKAQEEMGKEKGD